MIRLLKLIFFLIILGAISVVGFAFFGDLTPDRVEVNEPVELNVD